MTQDGTGTIDLDKWLVEPRIVCLLKSGRYLPTRLSLWSQVSLATGRISTTFFPIRETHPFVL